MRGATVALGHFVSKILRHNLDFSGGMAGGCPVLICPLSSRQMKCLKFSADDAYISF